jgi:hypothetical protein
MKPPAEEPNPTAQTPTSMIRTPSRNLISDPTNLLGTRFIGITGITDPGTARACVRTFKSYAAQKPALASTAIAFGFLTTLRTLTTGDYSGNRYLNAEGIFDACSTDPLAQNIVHLCAKTPENLNRSLTLIRNTCGDWINGVQLNVPHLKAADLRRETGLVYRGALAEGPRQTPLFLSLEPETLRQYDWNPILLARHVGTFIYDGGSRFAPCIDRVIIDPSEGKGKAMDPKKVLLVLRALRKEFPGLPLICSGGLSGRTVAALLVDIAEEMPDISTDAEGALRDEDHFDLAEANGYIHSTIRLFEDVSAV